MVALRLQGAAPRVVACADMPNHPPVPTGTKSSAPLLPEGPFREPPPAPVDSSLPLLGDSQFEMVLDPELVAQVALVPESALEEEAQARRNAPPPSLDLSDDEDLGELRRYHQRRTWLLIGANVAALGLGAYAVHQYLEQQGAELARLEVAHGAVTRDLDTTRADLVTARGERDQLQSRLEGAEAQLKTQGAELATLQAAAKAEADKLAWIPDAKLALETTLEPERKKGDVVVRVEGPRIFVELSERALFNGPDEVVHDAGTVLLQRLGPVLAGISGQSIEVRGHVDSAPAAATTAKYGNTYGWAAARAKVVEEVLTGMGKLPAKRVTVVSWGDQQPKSTQKSAAARKKNRRLEVVLGPAT